MFCLPKTAWPPTSLLRVVVDQMATLKSDHTLTAEPQFSMAA